MQISDDPGSHDPDPGPQEESTKKSCVSFETECTCHLSDGQTFQVIKEGSAHLPD